MSDATSDAIDHNAGTSFRIAKQLIHAEKNRLIITPSSFAILLILLWSSTCIVMLILKYIKTGLPALPTFG